MKTTLLGLLAISTLTFFDHAVLASKGHGSLHARRSLGYRHRHVRRCQPGAEDNGCEEYGAAALRSHAHPHPQPVSDDASPDDSDADEDSMTPGQPKLPHPPSPALEISPGEQQLNGTKKCRTYVVTVYGEPTLVHHTMLPPPTPSPVVNPPPKPQPQPPAPETSPAPTVAKVVTEKEHYEEHHEESYSKTSTTTASNGNRWAITYTPYQPTGQCKSREQVTSDVNAIAQQGFTTIRTYSTDCHGLENIGSACKAHNMKLIIGVYIDHAGIHKAQEQVDQIVSWKCWDIVEMVVIGNEAIFNNFISASELATFITETRGRLRKTGYQGPCTTTETLGVLQQHAAELCPVVDVVAANLHPFFNAAIGPEGAGDFVKEQLELTGKVCPGKEAYNLECGWPSAGSPNGAAVPGSTQQCTAVKSIMQSAGSKTVFSSFEDDGWKSTGQFNVEQHWGIMKALQC